MPVNIEIDQLTPCLERVKDSKIVETSFSAVSKAELMKINRWLFKWTDSDLTNCEIYKLTVNDDERIQGLIAIQVMQRDKAVYVKIAESAPHNKHDAKEYIGVGGHLFAIAVQRSYELGFDGFVYFDAKNISLVSHYARSLGAIFIGHPHPYRMIIDEEAAKKLIQIYNFGRD